MTREELLDAGKETVTKHRPDRYGQPEDNFARIAAFWAAYLGVPVRPHDVAALSDALKVVSALIDPLDP